MRGRAGVRAPGYWIDDENLLRDEGALFGLSCGDAESPETRRALAEKEACIVAHYERLAQRAVATLVFNASETERLVEALAEADAEAERKRREARQAQEARTGLEADARVRAQDRADRVTAAAALRLATPDALAPAAPVQVARYALGLLLTMAACAGVVLLVYDLLDHSRFDFSLPVSLGVAFAGLFCAFQPLALMLAGDARVQRAEETPEMWKLRFAEWSLPLVAAAFISYWASQPPLMLQSTLATASVRPAALADPASVGVTFAFLAVFFVLGGKLLLGLSTRLAIVLRQRRAERQLHEEATAEHERETAAEVAEHAFRVVDADAELARLTTLAEVAEQNAFSLRAQAEQLRLSSRDAHAERDGWKYLSEQRVTLFRSEFWLAVEQRRMALARPSGAEAVADAPFYVDEDGTITASAGDGASRDPDLDSDLNVEPDVDFGDDA